MPYGSPETIVVHPTYENGTKTALATAYDGQRGNPVLSGPHRFDELTAIAGDIGG